MYFYFSRKMYTSFLARDTYKCKIWQSSRILANSSAKIMQFQFDSNIMTHGYVYLVHTNTERGREGSIANERERERADRKHAKKKITCMGRTRSCMLLQTEFWISSGTVRESNGTFSSHCYQITKKNSTILGKLR